MALETLYKIVSGCVIIGPRGGSPIHEKRVTAVGAFTFRPHFQMQRFAGSSWTEKILNSTFYRLSIGVSERSIRIKLVKLFLIYADPLFLSAASGLWGTLTIIYSQTLNRIELDSKILK